MRGLELDRHFATGFRARESLEPLLTDLPGVESVPLAKEDVIGDLELVLAGAALHGPADQFAIYFKLPLTGWALNAEVHIRGKAARGGRFPVP